ncbi:hypothetical protein [Tiger frog virus]|uniref:Uncharacterized protein n=1 Tax=Rana tigrina ranavirus TaxID=160691 RepID=Q2WEX0_RTRV|nr:hypothetical protein [Tiger frog virus]
MGRGRWSLRHRRRPGLQEGQEDTQDVPRQGVCRLHRGGRQGLLASVKDRSEDRLGYRGRRPVLAGRRLGH